MIDVEAIRGKISTPPTSRVGVDTLRIQSNKLGVDVLGIVQKAHRPDKVNTLLAMRRQPKLLSKDFARSHSYCSDREWLSN